MKTFITSIIALIIGFGIAWASLPETRITTKRSNIENTDSTNSTTSVPNKFFEFADTFTKNRDVIPPGILETVPEFDVIVFYYPTSQESSQFGVYNYTTNELFTGIGNNDYVDSQQFVSILGNNQLLIWVSPGVDAAPNEPSKLMIKDFNNTTIKTIVLPSTMLPYFHEGYGYDSTTGKLYITVKNNFNHTPTTKYETYIFDEKAQTLTKQEVRG